MGATEQPSVEADPDREPTRGEDAVDTRHGARMHVLREHPQPAGEIQAMGETIAGRMDVAEDRACVWVVFHEDLAACSREIETHQDVIDAMKAGVVVPVPRPVSLTAPLSEVSD